MTHLHGRPPDGASSTASWTVPESTRPSSGQTCRPPSLAGSSDSDQVCRPFRPPFGPRPALHYPAAVLTERPGQARRRARRPRGCPEHDRTADRFGCPEEPRIIRTIRRNPDLRPPGKGRRGKFCEYCELFFWSCLHTSNFPRNHRFVLGERIERNLYGLLETLIAAKYRKDRRRLLEDANLSLEILRFQMRLAKDLQCLKLERPQLSPPRRSARSAIRN